MYFGGKSASLVIPQLVGNASPASWVMPPMEIQPLLHFLAEEQAGSAAWRRRSPQSLNDLWWVLYARLAFVWGLLQ